MNIKLSDIWIDEDFNCREKITRQSVFDLMSSIEKDGLIQPITVRLFQPDEENDKRYALVAGFRRMKACSMLEWEYIEATVKENMSRDRARIVNIQENIKREDLTLWEEAKALRYLVEAFPHMGEIELCNELSVSRGYFQPRIMLTKLPEQVHELAHQGFLGCQGARDLYQFEGTPKELAIEIGRLRTQAQARQSAGKEPKKLIVQTVKKDKRNPAAIAKQRKRKEINAVLEDLVDRGFGGHLFVKGMAWCAGNISDLEYCKEIEDYAEQEDITFIFDKTGFTDVINATL